MACKKLTPEQIAEAERIAKKLDAAPEHIKYYMSLYNKVSMWSKADLIRLFMNREKAFGRDVAKVLDKVMKEIVDPLEARVKALEGALSQRAYKGIWAAGAYSRENSVTYNGSVWIAKADTSSQPGTDDSWQLAVRKGRDGREARR